MSVAEAEFAFVIDRDLDAAAGLDFTMDEVLGAVRAMHLAMEVPDSRFARFETVGAAQLIADDACAGRFVLGRAVPAGPSWTWRTIRPRCTSTARSRRRAAGRTCSEIRGSR